VTVIERLREKANSLPASAGVYIMKDAEGKIIYVGKSKRLKNRVSSYFVGTHTSYKTARMVSLVRDFDFIVCDTEIEALSLENTLIKKHSPRYNIKLKDAKSYPYIRVSREEFPRFSVTRERKSDKSRYYGPYRGASDAYSALETVLKIFGLPTCKRVFPRDIGKERPCIYRDMGRCIAPCTGEVDREEYSRLVKCAEWVLDGNVRDTLESLNREMEAASEAMEFERAIVIRDSIRAIGRLREKQKVVADAKVNRDVFALYSSETESVLSVLTVRDGALVKKNEFVLSLSELTSPEDAVSLIADYYDRGGSVPREIMLDFGLSDEDLELLAEYLGLLAERRVVVRVPERGEGRALCDMALENAKEAAHQHRLEGEREDKNIRRLCELLGITEIPGRIEAYDISNFGNDCITASMVVWQGGKMKKSDYRSFTIKTTAGADDYGSMREALSRRLAHIGDGSASLGERPDIILLDGGVGHVHTVKELLSEMELDIPTYGMVKDDFHKTRAITDGEEEISIAREMGVYAIIYNIQEEAHRFALRHTTAQKTKSLTRSSLEQIDGIGPAKAKALLSSMPLARIKTSGVEELSAVKGISRKDAERIVAYFARAREKKGEKK